MGWFVSMVLSARDFQTHRFCYTYLYSSQDYRKEIDNIFYGIYEHYKTNTGLIFDKENQPTMIPLEGELHQKLATIAMYIGPDGNLVENEGSAIMDLQTAYEEECLRRQVR